MRSQNIPQAAGIGLRAQHHQQVIDNLPPVAWLEVHAENYFGGGAPLRHLDAVRCHYPVAIHGVGLSLGSADGLNQRHLIRLAALIERIEPCFVSEHLSWSVLGDHYFNDLLPLPYTAESLDRMVANIDRLQNELKRRVLIENPSSYLLFRGSDIPEWEFIATLAKKSGCGLLCDVNNIYVSAVNHDFDCITYLDALPVEAVQEIHLAGHAINDVDGMSILIDDHGSAVAMPVWNLYQEAVRRFPTAAALIEWDSDIPALEVLIAQANLANEKRTDTLTDRKMRVTDAA